jgi:hypothetical protein
MPEPFDTIAMDLKRLGLPPEVLRHRLICLRAASNVVQAAWSAVAANDLPGGADEALGHLADNLEALSAVAARTP